MRRERRKPSPSSGGNNGSERLLEESHPSHERDSHMPVYHISIVAEMVETHPQTLRMYERMGLVAPRRTRNNIRLYSDADVEQVRRIQHLTQDLGVNLAGVEVVFKLLREMYRMQEEIEGEIEAVRAEAEAAIEAAWREATQGNGKRK